MNESGPSAPHSIRIGGVGCRVVQGVLHEVVDHGVEIAGRSAHMGLGGARELDGVAVELGLVAPAVGCPLGHGRQGDRGRRRGRLAVLGQAQEVGEQLGQALGLELARDEVALEVGIVGPHAGRLQAQAQPGERGAQLMRGVGHEVALGVERAHEPLGHVVEGVGHLDLLASSRSGWPGCAGRPRRSGERSRQAAQRTRQRARRSSTPGPARAPARRRRGRAGRGRRGGPRRGPP